MDAFLIKKKYLNIDYVQCAVTEAPIVEWKYPQIYGNTSVIKRNVFMSHKLFASKLPSQFRKERRKVVFELCTVWYMSCCLS